MVKSECILPDICISFRDEEMLLELKPWEKIVSLNVFLQFLLK